MVTVQQGEPTLAMPSSESNAKARASPVSLRCVPPQNSMEFCLFDGSPGFARSSSTGLPMDTTLTGSGYCSPKTARSPAGPNSAIRFSLLVPHCLRVSTLHACQRSTPLYSRHRTPS